MAEGIEIIDYEARYALDFASLNYRWIESFFKIEDIDRQYLDHPQEMILDKGGIILFVRQGEHIIGTCALCKIEEGCYELAKMAIDPDIQGQGLGYRLGLAVIERAKFLGAKKVFLESNTILAPAIHLYRKLGFKEIKDFNSPYERADIQMELILN